MKSTAYPFWSMPSGGRFTKLPDYYQDYQNEMKRKKEEFEENQRQRDRERWRHFDPFGDFGKRSHPCDFDSEEQHDYRDAVRSTHPDKTGGDTEDEFREVQEAYEYYRRYHL